MNSLSSQPSNTADPALRPWISPGARLVQRSTRTLASHYSDALAFEWRQRRRRCESTAYDFAQLIRWDQRIEAYLKGFDLLGSVGVDQGLERLEDPITEGDLFSLTSQALIARHQRLMQACISLVQAMPHFSRAFHAALEWMDWSAVEFALGLWPFDDPLRQAVVLRSLASHVVHVEPGYAASSAPRLSTAPWVQLSALRCALSRGEPGWAMHAPDLVNAASHELQLAAAEALIVFGNQDQRLNALSVLRTLAVGGSGQVAMLATRELMTLGGAEAEHLLDALASDPARTRQHLAAMGWGGELACVPRLAEWLDSPEHRRAAAAALTTLTGSCPQRDGWAVETDGNTTKADPHSDHIPAGDPDVDLPSPDRAAFAGWWHEYQQTSHGTSGRRLAGRPREATHLLAILREGRLAVRPQAAWLLQVATRGRRLPHLAPARQQTAQIDHLMESDTRG